MTINVQAIAARAWGANRWTYARERRGALNLIRMQRESLAMGLNRGFEAQYLGTIADARSYLVELRKVRGEARRRAAVP